MIERQRSGRVNPLPGVDGPFRSSTGLHVCGDRKRLDRRELRGETVSATTDETPAAHVPTALSVEEAAAMLGIGRTLAYELIRTGAWPTPILHLGRLIKIPSGPMTSLLQDGRLPNGDAASAHPL